MEPHAKDGSLKFAEFISYIFDTYFPCDREYGGTFDGEQSALLSGDEASLDTDHKSKFTASD